jgi:hypothetical protein
MPSKKIKKTIKPTTIITPNKYVKIPLVGVIIFSLLLATSSFFAGITWLKINNNDTNTSSNSKITFEAEKTNKPELKFFVMSFCPYGNQMEDTLKPVVNLLSKVVDIRPQYIFSKITNLSDYCKQTSGDVTQCAAYIQAGYFPTEAECQKIVIDGNKKCNDEKNYLKIGNNFYSSLHGRVEANQDVREICAYNMSDDKTNWWTFVDNVNINCTYQNADTCWEEQAKKANFDTAKITECFNKQAGEIMDKEIAITDQYKVQSSPTLIINGVNFPPETASTQDGKGSLKIGKKTFTQDKFYTADVIKEAICASFKKTPKECKTILADAVATTETAAADSGAGCATQ